MTTRLPAGGLAASPLASSVVASPPSSSVVASPLASSVVASPPSSSVVASPLASSVVASPPSSSVVASPLASSVVASPLASSLESPHANATIASITVSRARTIDRRVLFMTLPSCRTGRMLGRGAEGRRSRRILGAQLFGQSRIRRPPRHHHRHDNDFMNVTMKQIHCQAKQ